MQISRLKVGMRRGDGGGGCWLAGNSFSKPGSGAAFWPVLSPGSNDTGIFVSDIIRGGVADSDGRLLLGDQIVSINGVDARAASLEQAQKLLQVSGEKFVNSSRVVKNELWIFLLITSPLSDVWLSRRVPVGLFTWRWLGSKPDCSTHLGAR